MAASLRDQIVVAKTQSMRGKREKCVSAFERLNEMARAMDKQIFKELVFSGNFQS